MIEQKHEIMSIKKRCELLDITRSTLYYKNACVNEVSIINEMREIYEQCPFYGYRRIHVVLRQHGMIINRKRVQRLMKFAGIKAIYPLPKTSVKNQEHTVYKYLLKNLAITRSDQVWQVDITYVKIRHGFVYLVCLIDVFSRRIMGWNLSTFLDTNSCEQALYNALLNSKPEIINSDQGCQFTSEKWISCLIKNGVQISMDGKGRWADNVHVERLWKTIKYESVFLHSFDTVQQANDALAKYIEFYNNERPHQALNYHTPSVIHGLNKIPSKQELFNGFINQNRKDCSMIPKLA
jgi:putative transposase